MSVRVGERDRGTHGQVGVELGFGARQVVAQGSGHDGLERRFFDFVQMRWS